MWIKNTMPRRPGIAWQANSIGKSTHFDAQAAPDE